MSIIAETSGWPKSAWGPVMMIMALAGGGGAGPVGAGPFNCLMRERINSLSDSKFLRWISSGARMPDSFSIDSRNWRCSGRMRSSLALSSGGDPDDPFQLARTFPRHLGSQLVLNMAEGTRVVDERLAVPFGKEMHGDVRVAQGRGDDRLELFQIVRERPIGKHRARRAVPTRS